MVRRDGNQAAGTDYLLPGLQFHRQFGVFTALIRGDGLLNEHAAVLHRAMRVPGGVARHFRVVRTQEDIARILRAKWTQHQPRGHQRGLSMKDTAKLLWFHLLPRELLNYSA